MATAATCHSQAICETCGNGYGALDPTNHDGGTELRGEEVESCTEAGYTGDTYCKGCNTKLSTGSVIPASGHEYEDNVVAPTCEEDGYTAHSCKKCDDTYNDTPVGKLGHDYTDVSPDWTWTGYTKAVAKFVCTRSGCDHFEEVTAEGAAITSEVTREPVGDVDGERTYTATVTFDGTQYTSERKQTILATGHDFENVTPTWEWNASHTHATASFVCNICHNTLTEEAQAGDIEVETTAATCTQAGSVVYTATVTFCDETYSTTYTDTLTALGHDYTDVLPVWDWEADHSSATATFACKRSGCDHTEQLTDDQIQSVTTPATCESEGATVYSSKVRFEGADHTDEVSEPIEKLGHTYSDTLAHDATGHWYPSTCKASHTDPTLDKKDREAHTFSYTVTAEPGPVVPGKATAHCDCGETVTDVNIPRLNLNDYEYSESDGNGVLTYSVNGVVVYSKSYAITNASFSIGGTTYNNVKALIGIETDDYSLKYTEEKGFVLTVKRSFAVTGRIVADKADLSIVASGGKHTLTVNGNTGNDAIQASGAELSVTGLNIVASLPSNADKAALSALATTLTDCSITIDKYGYGIYVSGTVVLENCTVTSTGCTNGTISAYSYTSSTVRLKNTTVTSDGIAVKNCRIVLDGATVSGAATAIDACTIFASGTDASTVKSRTGDAVFSGSITVDEGARLIIEHDTDDGSVDKTGINMSGTTYPVLDISGVLEVRYFINAIGRWNGGTIPSGLTVDNFVAKCCTNAINDNNTKSLSEAITHNEVVDVTAIQATCTSAGRTKGSHCDDCGAVLAVSEVTAVTGHTLSASSSVTAPSFTDAGSIDATCEVCHAVFQTALPALNTVDYVYSEYKDGSDLYARFTYYDGGEAAYMTPESEDFLITRSITVGDKTFNNVKENVNNYASTTIAGLSVTYASGVYTLTVAAGQTAAINGAIVGTGNYSVTLTVNGTLTVTAGAADVEGIEEAGAIKLMHGTLTVNGSGTLNIVSTDIDAISAKRILIESGTLNARYHKTGEQNAIDGTGIAIRSGDDKSLKIVGGDITIDHYKYGIATWASGKLWLQSGAVTVTNCEAGIYMPYFDYANDAKIYIGDGRTDGQSAPTLSVSVAGSGSEVRGIYANMIKMVSGTVTITNAGFDSGDVSTAVGNGIRISSKDTATSTPDFRILGGSISITGFEIGVCGTKNGQLWLQNGALTVTSCKKGIVLTNGGRIDIGRDRVSGTAIPELTVSTLHTTTSAYGIELDNFDVFASKISVTTNGANGIVVYNWLNINNKRDDAFFIVTNALDDKTKTGIKVSNGGRVSRGFILKITGYDYAFNDNSNITINWNGDIQWDHAGCTNEGQMTWTDQ